ncbi:MAG: VWA domain-containing protein [Planctomycetota bacterium]|nr:VWA domain-containing protein [Planctomycetota bacterium]
MHFQFPAQLAWAWLLVPVVLLFLVRRRPKKVKVSTLAFFKSLAHVYRESPWLRRLKKLLALLIAAATVGFGVFALAQLVVAPEAGDLRSVLVVVDGSASMAAVDEDGRSRLEVAKERIRTRLAGLQSSVGVLLMRYDRRPEILVPTSYDRRSLLRELDGLAVRPVPGDADTALRLAARLAALNAPAAIWHVTDAPLQVDGGADDATPESDTEEVVVATLEERLGIANDVELESMVVGLPRATNAGITGFQIRPRPLERGRFDAFVEVHAQGPADVEVKLEVRLDQKLVSLRDLTVPPGGSERLLIPVEGGRGSVLTLEARTEGDVLAEDDSVHARIPEARPVRLLWVRAKESVDPFTQLALVALGEEGVLEAFETSPETYDAKKETFDVILFDGWLPETWPTQTPVLVMKPPRSLGPVRTAPIAGDGLPIDELRAVDERHPVLYGVASDRVAVTQTAVLEAGGSLAPLWTGAMGPLLVAGEVRGQKLVVMAFAADRSERLGLMASYPLLLGNAVFWLSQGEEEERQGNNLRTGRVVEAEGDAIVWEDDAGTEVGRTPLAGGGTVAELDRLGLWRIGEKSGSASLLSKSETLITTSSDEVEAGAATATSGFLSGDMRPLLLWLLLALLVVEAWLFHRHAVY